MSKDEKVSKICSLFEATKYLLHKHKKPDFFDQVHCCKLSCTHKLEFIQIFLEDIQYQTNAYLL